MAPRWIRKAQDVIEGLGARRILPGGGVGEPVGERPVVDLGLPQHRGLPGTKDQQDRIRAAQALCEEWEEERHLQVMEWLAILTHYAGMQNRQMKGRTWLEIAESKTEWKVVINYLARYVRLVSSTLGEQKPVPRTIPATDDDEDIWAAELGKKVLGFLQKELMEDKKTRRLRLMVLLLGKGFKFAFWDPRAEARVALGEQGLMDQTGAFDLRGRERVRRMAVGQCASEVVSALEFLASSFTPTLEEQPCYAIRRLRTEEWITSLYPASEGFLSRMERPQQNGKFLMWQERLSLANLATSSKKTAKSRIVTHYVERGHGGGDEMGYRVTCYSGDVWLGEWLARLNPATEYPCFEEEGYFWGSGLGALLLPLQREKDAIATDFRIHRRLHTHPMWLNPTGSNLVLTNEPGKVFNYDPDPTTGAKPEVVTPPALNPEAHAYAARIDNEFKEMSNYHDVSQASVPSGITAARAIGLLQEADLKAWGEFAHGWNDAEAQHYRKLLDIVQEKWSVPRVIATVGRENRMFVEAVLGANLRSVQDVVFEMGPRAMSQEERLELGMAMADKGYFLPENSAMLEKILEFAGMGGPVEKDATPEGVARKFAQIVVKKLREGEYVIFEPWHDLGVIMETLKLEINKPEFADLPREIRQLFGEAITQAENLQFQELVRAQGKMQAAGQLAMMAGAGAAAGMPQEQQPQAG